jgi:ABC-2 type transport system permease protein
MNPQRVGVLVLRYIFIYRRSPIRLLEVLFWPTITLLLWGFMTIFIQRSTEGDLPRFIIFLIGAMICWDILFRAQQGVSLSFLEDIWARNLLNIFCAPVRLGEYVCATFLFGLLRVGITLSFLCLLAWLLYHFNFFSLGVALIPFIANLLLLGLTIGIVTIAIVLRYGHGAEPFAWALPFLLQPFSAVFYPVSVLPRAMQQVAWAVPSTYVFEGMREVIRSGSLSWNYLAWAVALNLIYLALALVLLVYIFNVARDHGLLGKWGMQ